MAVRPSERVMLGYLWHQPRDFAMKEGHEGHEKRAMRAMKRAMRAMKGNMRENM